MNWSYGLKCEGPLEQILEITCDILRSMGYEWQFIDSEMRFKCRTKVNADELADDDEVIKEFLRQKFLKFYITIFR